MHIDFPMQVLNQTSSQTVKYLPARLSGAPGEYVQRLQQLKKEAPELLIPHAYTRWDVSSTEPWINTGVLMVV